MRRYDHAILDQLECPIVDFIFSEACLSWFIGSTILGAGLPLKRYMARMTMAAPAVAWIVKSASVGKHR
jgi:hypothetical protein